MTEQTRDKSRSNIGMAIVLGLIAVGFYMGFILVTANGSVQ
jgi:hypothetical protein